MRGFILMFLVLYQFLGCRCDGCMDMVTCGDCMGYADDTCVWCSAANHLKSRCLSKSSAVFDKEWCLEAFYDIPIHEPVYQKHDPLASGKKAVQFTPQQVSVKLRPGKPVHVSAYYKPAVDYPLDVYYLMDNSFTMKPHKTLLQNNAQFIYDELRSLTSNVQMGFGSFVEKPALPFSDPFVKKTYIFKNHKHLTTEIHDLKKSIIELSSVGNYDDQEASLDAVMQVMVCEDQLKWRKDARRIIVVCTDNTYHSYGDGKIAGAAQLNDMKCHMVDDIDVDGNSSVTLDYPSVGQIDKIASGGHFKIIFNVMEETKEAYQALANEIQGAIYSKLSNKAADVVNNIKTEYLNLVRSLKLHVKSQDTNNIKVQLDPECNKLENGCEVKHGQAVKINITIEATKCIPNAPWEEVRIGPVGLSDKLIIKVQTICECECENKSITVAYSQNCNQKGSYQCGICKCYENSYGPTCRCTGSSSDYQDLDKCKAHQNDTTYCSGHGDCLCGKCENCRDDYYGQFCENQNICPEVNGKECSGNGKCIRGKCNCFGSVWSGSVCNCDDRECLHPNTMQICSGKGQCHCGKCVCDANSTKLYYGTFCDQCSDCDSIQCKDLEDFAYCHYQGKDECNQKYKGQGSICGQVINETSMSSPEYYLYKKCKKELDDESFMVFSHNWPSKNLKVIVQKEAEKPVKANIWIAVGSVIGVMLIIGLLTLLSWKILVHIHDTREYEKFMKEMAQAGLASVENCLYIEPAVHYQNPKYNLNKRED